MSDKLCPKCGKGLYYNEKTGIFKCKNGKCRRIYTLSKLKSENIGTATSNKRKSKYFKKQRS